MSRLRELLSSGGIALLGVVFALAFAAFYLADALSQVTVSVLDQHVESPESGGPLLGFRIWGTEIDYEYALQQAVSVVLILAGVYAVWCPLPRCTHRLARSSSAKP